MKQEHQIHILSEDIMALMSLLMEPGDSIIKANEKRTLSLLMEDAIHRIHSLKSERIPQDRS